jgi:hypothetical protein
MVIDFTRATDSADWIGRYSVGAVPSEQSSQSWSYQYHGSVFDNESVVITPGAAGHYYMYVVNLHARDYGTFIIP